MEGALCWMADRGFVLGEWKGFCVGEWKGLCVGWMIGVLCLVSGRGFLLVG